MGFGMALGGMAQGLESAENAFAKKRALDMQQQGMMQDQAMAERGLALKEQALGEKGRQSLLGEADKIIAAHVKTIGEVVKAGREAGESPDKIAAAIEPLLADVEALSSKAGRDAAPIRTRVGALLSTSGTPQAPKVGGTLEGIKAKLASGEALSPGEKQVYDDAQRMSKFDRLLLGMGDEAPAAPAEPAAPAPAAAPAAATTPPVPENLKGKPGLAWSPSKQRWYISDGSSFNAQGIPQ